MIYVLAYPQFEPHCSERIDTFRAKHEPQRAELVPPHVTLVFGVDDAHLNNLTKLVETASTRTPEFRVEFSDSKNEFDPFEQKYKIFLLCGEGSGALTSLHTQLYDGEHRAELSPEHPFRPHMTIASYAERADIEKVSTDSLGSLPIFGKVRSLVLVRFANGRLTTLKSAPLLR